MKNAILAALLVMLAALALIALSACKLDPAKVPPCTGRDTYPDPCAAAPRDAGAE